MNAQSQRDFEGRYDQAAADHAKAAHCVEIEQALLGSILSYEDAYFHVAEFLRPGHFFEAVHARIFEACAAMREEGRRCNPITVLPLFRDDETLKGLDCGPSGYFANLAGAAAPLIAVKEYGRNIYEYAQRRRISRLAEDLADRATGLTVDESPGDIVSEAIRSFTEDPDLASSRIKRTQFDAGEIMDRVVTRVNDVFRDGVQPGEVQPFCGTTDVHRALGGWKRKRFYVIAGRPGMGKSTVALSMLTRTASKGHGVLFLSLEMEEGELAERMLSDLCYGRGEPIPYERIGNNQLVEREIARLADAAMDRAKLPIKFDVLTRPSLGKVRVVVQQTAQRMAAAGGRLEVVCIDHIGLMDLPGQQTENTAARIEALTGGLKAMAKDLDIAVIGLCQLSRAVESRDDKRPQLSDLRNSGGIEQDADVVIMLYREAYYLERRKENDSDKDADRERRLGECRYDLEFIIEKNRGGSTRTVRLFANMGSSAVRDADGHH